MYLWLVKCIPKLELSVVVSSVRRDCALTQEVYIWEGTDLRVVSVGEVALLTVVILP